MWWRRQRWFLEVLLQWIPCSAAEFRHIFKVILANPTEECLVAPQRTRRWRQPRQLWRGTGDRAARRSTCRRCRRIRGRKAFGYCDVGIVMGKHVGAALLPSSWAPRRWRAAETELWRQTRGRRAKRSTCRQCTNWSSCTSRVHGKRSNSIPLGAGRDTACDKYIHRYK